MFNRDKRDLRMLNPSSKITLKLSCLEYCRGDVDKAQKLYAFMAEGSDLPDFPQDRPNFIQQFTQSAEQLFGWVDQNGEKLLKGYNMIQMIRGNAANIVQQAASAAPEVTLPPLPPLE